MSDCCAVKGSRAGAALVMGCPVSGTRAKRVGLQTVRALVRRLPLSLPPVQYYFCDAPDCDVVYFSPETEAPVFRRADLLVRVRGKEQDEEVPVCYCFGFTPKDIQNEIRKTGKTTIAKRIQAEVQAGRCACEVKNPSGKCCLGDVGRAEQAASRNAPGGANSGA